MLNIFLMEWWKAMGSTDQAFLSMAIVSTLLLAMLIANHLMGLEQDAEPSGKANSDRKRQWFDARMFLVFCTLCSWLIVAFIFAELSLSFSLLFALLIAAPLTFFGRYLIKKWLTPSEDVNRMDLLLQTGEVLQYIPPHRNGFGKVHFSLPEAPFQIEAITAGQELSPGSHVRVVDVIDDRIILVEPIEEEYPGQGIDR
jgi:membrane protein implicated in regulation of membrane protease activity